MVSSGTLFFHCVVPIFKFHKTWTNADEMNAESEPKVSHADTCWDEGEGQVIGRHSPLNRDVLDPHIKSRTVTISQDLLWIRSKLGERPTNVVFSQLKNYENNCNILVQYHFNLLWYFFSQQPLKNLYGYTCRRIGTSLLAAATWLAQDKNLYQETTWCLLCFFQYLPVLISWSIIKWHHIHKKNSVYFNMQFWLEYEFN